jgi:hypothetical protein
VGQPIISVLILCAAAGCNLFGPNECGTPNRSVLAQGSVPAEAAGATVGIREEQAGDSVRRTVSWSVFSNLKPRITRVELRDGSDGTFIALFGLMKPLPTPPADMLVSNATGLPYDWPLPIDDLRRRFAAGKIVVEFHTDLPDRPLIRVALTAQVSDWHRDPCPD